MKVKTKRINEEEKLRRELRRQFQRNVKMQLKENGLRSLEYTLEYIKKNEPDLELVSVNEGIGIIEDVIESHKLSLI